MKTSTTVLIIGDPQRLFLEDESRPKAASYVVCLDVLTGIQQAAQQEYQVVALEIQGLALKLGAILKSLRQVSKARLVLMSQIYDEPIARHYVQGTAGEPSPADDYFICPVNLGRWLARWEPHSGAQCLGDDQTGVSNAVGVNVERRLRELERLATEDDLTGLKNRRYVREFCRQILDYAENEHGRVTLLVYDIDDFKRYNDQYGHATGDRILQEAATLMRRCCRGHDVIARIGGDEFAVVFWDDPSWEHRTGQSERRVAGTDHPEDALFVAQRFQQALKRSDLGGLGPNGKGLLTISGGLARYPIDADTVEKLFEKADLALLEAKRQGKNRITLVGKLPKEMESDD